MAGMVKALNAANRQILLDWVNEWWENEKVPAEILDARVALIFKKGNATDCGNYKPISLLNSSYKVFASILQQRISQALDPYLHKLQSGFRKERSTAQALHIIRRLQDVYERSG